MKLETLLGQYNYTLPESLIAKTPATPRDSARLLVWDQKTGKITEDSFLHLGDYIPKNALLVFNQTRVIPARLAAHKPTGGKVELLYLSHHGQTLTCLANKPLAVGTTVSIFYGRKKWEWQLTVLGKKDGKYTLLSSLAGTKIPQAIKDCGITPLPPYMKDSPLPEKERRKWYQTIFAKKGASVAAPTASLHFTQRLLQKLKKKGIGITYIQLDVGLGTFAPLTQEHITSGKLHEEYYFISPQAHALLTQAKKAGRPIIAVGTTVVRTLESAYKNPNEPKLSGTTDLFIAPGFTFSMVDGLITNFHVPKSSLLMLVSALVGKGALFKLYRYAIAKKFRFFSFGDGMLVKPNI